MALQFDELQGEVKAKIFSLLTPVERQIIRPVCLDWKELIDEEFGIKLRVNNGTANILLNSAEYAVELELNSLTIPVDGTGMIFAHKLTTLRFQNIVVTYNLFPLLKSFANSLVTLSFHQIIVDLPEQLQRHYRFRGNVRGAERKSWCDFADTVRANSETLETFWIAGQSFNQAWNCDVFSSCIRLRKLCVQLYMSPKIHLSALPSTLTHLNISGSIKRDELAHLANVLVNIIDAEFTHLGINQSADTPEDRMDLDLFKRYILLPKLLKISFLHCDWLDQEWDDVIQWCSQNTTHGIAFEQLFYPMHGQPIRHGIHVNIPPNFDRNQIDVGHRPETLQASSSSHDMCHILFSALTCWYF